MIVKQCGNCKWWNKEHAQLHDRGGLYVLASSCLAPVPECALFGEITDIMAVGEGKTCPVFTERTIGGY